jgi:enoyl-CoA hydratase
MSDTSGADDGKVSVSHSHDDRVATIILDRAAKLNALTLGMLDDFRAVCSDLSSSKAEVIVVRTAGEKVFSVGADINHFSGLAAVDMWRRWISSGHRAFDALATLPQPTVVAVDGLAYGGGLELALAADFRVLAANARIAFPETGLGTVPGWGGTERLAALVGEHRAKEMILTRRVLDASEALGWGVATRVAVDGEFEVALGQLLDELLGSAPVASQLAKQIIRAGVDGASSSILEALASGVAAASDDLAEGVAAFREKRPPRFSNR